MGLLRLAAKNVAGSSFRSWLVAICTLFVSGLAVFSYLILNGAQDSLQLAASRLGADLIVVPAGSETKIETALLMGSPVEAWMPTSKLKAVAAVSGVGVASPQIYLSSLKGASCCSVSDMFLVVYDPETDFTITPWLENNLGRPLRQGEAIAGTYVYLPKGEQNIKLYGCLVTLAGNLQPTGTSLDQSVFFTVETAREMSRLSYTKAEKPLVVPENSISSILVRVKAGADPAEVAVRIMQQVPDVTLIESPDLFASQRSQLSALLKTIPALLAVTLIFALGLIALIFSLAANERRREIGVLRALGATRIEVLRSLLAEAVMLGLAGAVPGILLAILCVYLFRTLIVNLLGVPFIFPSLAGLMLLLIVGLALVLLSVAVATLFPSMQISRLDPAVAMRE